MSARANRRLSGEPSQGVESQALEKCVEACAASRSRMRKFVVRMAVRVSYIVLTKLARNTRGLVANSPEANWWEVTCLITYDARSARPAPKGYIEPEVEHVHDRLSPSHSSGQ